MYSEYGIDNTEWISRNRNDCCCEMRWDESRCIAWWLLHWGLEINSLSFCSLISSHIILFPKCPNGTGILDQIYLKQILMYFFLYVLNVILSLQNTGAKTGAKNWCKILVTFVNFEEIQRPEFKRLNAWKIHFCIHNKKYN